MGTQAGRDQDVRSMQVPALEHPEGGSQAPDVIVFAKPIDDRRALYRIMFDDGEFADATPLK